MAWLELAEASQKGRGSCTREVKGVRSSALLLTTKLALSRQKRQAHQGKELKYRGGEGVKNAFLVRALTLT